MFYRRLRLYGRNYCEILTLTFPPQSGKYIITVQETNTIVFKKC